MTSGSALTPDGTQAGTLTDNGLLPGPLLKQGRVVLAGMARMEIPLQTMDMIHKQAEIRGLSGGTKQDIAEAYELLASGDVFPVVTTIEFDDIPQGLEDLQHQRMTGRLVAQIRP